MNNIPFLKVFKRLPEGGVSVLPDPLEDDGEEKRLNDIEFQKLKKLMPNVKLWLDITEE